MISPNSGEEIFEWRENFVGDVPVDNPQHIGNRAAPEPFWGALAEAYVTGCCEIHAHFRASTVEGGILGDWCAFVKKGEKDLDFVNVDTVGDEECESGEVIQGDSVGQPVLIFDRELVKLPEGGRYGTCPLACTVAAARSLPWRVGRYPQSCDRICPKNQGPWQCLWKGSGTRNRP